MGFVGNCLKNLGALRMGREPMRPLMFSYYVTPRCNLNCRYCCDGEGKRFREDPIPELGTAEAKRLVSTLREASDTLDITGGEPLMRGDLEDILGDARPLGFRTASNTKGIGIEGRPDLMRFTDVLVLSLDTLDPGPLAELIGRPPDEAERILAALRHVLAVRRRTGTMVALSAVATPDNLAQVARVLRFAVENSLGFHLSPEILGTKVNPRLRDNEGYRRLIGETLAMKRAHRGVFGVPEYLLGIRDFGAFRCHPLLMPTIRPDGRMYYPCLEWKKAEIAPLETGSYAEAPRTARRRFGEIPVCRDCRHIFSHMALSLFHWHPLSALRELKHWRN